MASNKKRWWWWFSLFSFQVHTKSQFLCQLFVSWFTSVNPVPNGTHKLLHTSFRGGRKLLKPKMTDGTFCSLVDFMDTRTWLQVHINSGIWEGVYLTTMPFWERLNWRTLSHRQRISALFLIEILLCQFTFSFEQWLRSGTSQWCLQRIFHPKMKISDFVFS